MKFITIFLAIFIIFNINTLNAQQSNFIQNTKIIQKFDDDKYENKYDIGNNLNNYSDGEYSLFANSYKNVSGYLGNSNTFTVNVYLNEGNSVEIISQMSFENTHSISSIYNVQNKNLNLMLDNELYQNYNNGINFSVDSEFKAPETGVYEFSFNLNDSTNVSSLAFKVYENEYSDTALEKPYQRVWSKTIPTFNSAYYLTGATAMDISDINISYNYSVQDFQGGSLYFDTGEIEGLKNSPAGFTIDSNQYGISKGSSDDVCDIPLISAKQSWIRLAENIERNTCSISAARRMIGVNNFSNITPAPNINDGQLSEQLPEFFDFNDDGIIDQKSEYIKPIINEDNRVINGFKVEDVFENGEIIRNKFNIIFNIGQLSNSYHLEVDYDNNGIIDENIDISSNDLNVKVNESLNPYDNEYSYVITLKRALKPESNLKITLNSGEYSQNHLLFSDMNQMNDLDVYNYSQQNDLQFYNDEPLSHLSGVYEPYIFNGLNGVSSKENIRGWDGEFGTGSGVDTWVEDNFDYTKISAKDELVTNDGAQFIINKSIDENQLANEKLVFKIEINELSSSIDKVKIKVFDKMLQNLDKSIFDVENINVIDVGKSENLNQINYQNLTSDNGIEYLFKNGDEIKLVIEIDILDFEKMLKTEIQNTAYIEVDNQLDSEYCVDSLIDIEFSDSNDCMSSVESYINYDAIVGLTQDVKYSDKFYYETIIKNNSQIAGDVIITNKFEDSEMKNMIISSIQLSNGEVITQSDLESGYLVKLKPHELFTLSYTIDDSKFEDYEQSDLKLINKSSIICQGELICEIDEVSSKSDLKIKSDNEEILNTGMSFINLIYIFALLFVVETIFFIRNYTR